MASMLAPFDESAVVRLAAARPSRSLLFSVLIGVSVANGLVPKIGASIEAAGLPLAVFSTFGISAVVWIAIAAAIDLIRRDHSPASDLDLLVGILVLGTLVIPVAPLAWFGLTGLSLHIIHSSVRDTASWRGGWIALGVTVTMLWTPNLFKLLSGPILAFDATLVSTMLGLARDGNVVALADGSGSLWIAPACSSLANVSLAVLFWITLVRVESLPITLRSLSWCVLGCLLVVFANVVRIGLIALRPDWYEQIHGPAGAMVVGWVITGLIGVVGFAAVRSGRAHLV